MDNENNNLYRLPQEKLMYSGASSLSDVELLALIIRTGTAEKKVIQLAEEVMNYTDDLSQNIASVDARELLNVDGIGISKACSIVASMELARRVRRSSLQSGKTITTAEDIILNTKCKIESEYTVSIGELNSADIHPREVYSIAIRRSAAAIIIAHNHPSGDPTPSNLDIAATKRLEAVGKIVGIKLLDHIIVGCDSYVSLRSEGIIEQDS